MYKDYQLPILNTHVCSLNLIFFSSKAKTYITDKLYTKQAFSYT